MPKQCVSVFLGVSVILILALIPLVVSVLQVSQI
jgi:hypothetical protein